MGNLMFTIVFKKPDAEVMSDLDATLAFAKSTGSADVERAAVIGFCWGGRQVWLYAAHNPSLKAAVAWYGPLGPPYFGSSPPLRPQNPPDVVSDLKVPVLGLYSGIDSAIPLEGDEGQARGGWRGVEDHRLCRRWTRVLRGLPAWLQPR